MKNVSLFVGNNSFDMNNSVKLNAIISLYFVFCIQKKMCMCVKQKSNIE